MVVCDAQAQSAWEGWVLRSSPPQWALLSLGSPLHRSKSQMPRAAPCPLLVHDFPPHLSHFVCNGNSSDQESNDSDTLFQISFLQRN